MIFTDMLTLHKLLRRVYDQAMEPVCLRHEVTRMELDVLMFLSSNLEMDTAAELVSLCGFTKSHVSIAVASLEARGLLARSFRSGNRKTFHLTPMRAAADIIADGHAAQCQLLHSITTGFSPAELDGLHDTMDRIIENLRASLT